MNLLESWKAYEELQAQRVGIIQKIQACHPVNNSGEDLLEQSGLTQEFLSLPEGGERADFGHSTSAGGVTPKGPPCHQVSTMLITSSMGLKPTPPTIGPEKLSTMEESGDDTSS